jgi:predicted membrane protein
MSWIKENIAKTIEICSIEKKQKQFGFLLAGLLIFILLKSFYKQGFILDKTQLLLLISSLLFVTFAFFKSIVFYPFLLIWMFVGSILGEISSFIVFMITYFVFLSPIVLLMQIFSKKKNNHGWENKTNKIDYTKLY